jgi:2-amino-4-hydroxy-6-hydroxymethyldihydropteridine diphosphokinase
VLLQRVVVGLGANLGPCVDTLAQAAEQLGAVGAVLARSQLYRTAPIGPEQPDFYNAAVLLETPQTPATLLASLLTMERHAGRIRDVRWGPRLLDLDILWISGVSCCEPNLVVPHPRLRERAFALRPLLDVAPDAGDAAGPYQAALEAVLDQVCVAVSDPRWTPGALRS